MDEDREQSEVSDDGEIEQVVIEGDEESDGEYVRNSVDSPDFHEGSVGVGPLDVPNGLLDEDTDEYNESDDDQEEDIPPLEEDDGEREIPLQPRINLRQLLGQQTVDDSSESEDDEREEDGERFDQQLPGQHSYLGPGRQVGGRSLLDEDSLVVSLPLLPQPGLALLPGQLLPLHLFHPALIGMVRDLVNGPKAGRTFGVIGSKDGDLKGTVGTTAEIFEVRDSDGERGGEQEVGLKLKARGRQRFRLLSARRQLDGNLIGEVVILPDKDLGDPLENIRLRSQDRLRDSLEEEEETYVNSSPEEEKRKVPSCFAFLTSLGHTSSTKDPPEMRPRPLGLRGFCRGRMTRHLSPLPSWIWDMYDPACLADKVTRELGKMNIISPPSSPTDLSWWVAANLPLEDSLRLQILGLNCPQQRLRLELSFLEQCRVLVCKRCSKQLGEQGQIFSMSREGPQGAFVNPGGVVHETLTLYRAKNLRLVGSPSTEYSWFPGYAWTITECTGCWNHIGWKFTSGSKKLNPEKFYGFSRRSIETKVEVPTRDKGGEQTEERIHVM